MFHLKTQTSSPSLVFTGNFFPLPSFSFLYPALYSSLAASSSPCQLVGSVGIEAVLKLELFYLIEQLGLSREVITQALMFCGVWGLEPAYCKQCHLNNSSANSHNLDFQGFRTWPETLVPFYSWSGSVGNLCAVVIFITACHSAFRESLILKFFTHFFWRSVGYSLGILCIKYK